jgi:general secretion pathway protein D
MTRFHNFLTAHRGKNGYSLFFACILSFAVSYSAIADEITLNLKDADIRALISTVSKFTGKNFIIDPRVKAKITVISAKTMSPDEVYEVFLSILQVHGFAAVPTGSIIKIVPSVNAKQGPLPLVKGKIGSGDELITRIIKLNHVPAAQLVPILRPLVPQQGHLAAYNPTNTLIITDHSGNIQRLMKIIAGVDLPESDELEIIRLQHASASEIVRILNSLKRPAGKGESSKLTLAADDRTNSILMSGDKSARLTTRATIAHLDTPLEDGGNTQVIYLKYAQAENIVKILTGLTSAGKNKTGKRSPRLPTAKAKAAAGKSTGGSIVGSDAIIMADEETNALIISADPNTLVGIKSVIRQLDIRRAQVMIEAIIAEISTTKDKELGVGMAVDGSLSSNNNIPIGLSNFGGLGGILGALGTGDATALGSVVTPGLTLAAGGTNSNGTRYALLLRALATDSATNILSTPSIVTLDNEEAEIIVGQNVPFVTGQFTNAATTSTNPFQTINRQDVGLTLKVTPQVNEGDTIKLDLEQEVSDVISISDTSGPTTRKRSIKTSVLVDDGGILVLGGLIQESVNETETKVPLLGDIPLLGRLFQSSTSSKEKQNLMVFLRPSILRDGADASYLTNEKYNYLRSLQQLVNEEGFDSLDDIEPELPKRIPQQLDQAQAKVKPVVDEPEDEFDWDDDDDFI